MSRNIAVIGTLDTKGDEIKFIKEDIEKRGHKAIVIDVGIVGKPSFKPDISNQEVAQAAGTSIEALIVLHSEAKAMDKVAEGVSKIMQEYYSNDRMDGALALGGTMGTSLALTVMDAMPIGFPKLILSTVAFSPLIPHTAIKTDLMMMEWVAGLKGINSINRQVLKTAAGAIAGAAEGYEKSVKGHKTVVGVTSHGTVPSKFLSWLLPALEERGYEVAVFHAVGGGKAFERAIDEGLIDAVLDLTLSEISNEVAGGMASAGESRLEAAGRKGIPQIVAPTVSAIQWATSKPLPPRFKDRFFREHNWLVSVLPTNKEEKVAAGEFIAEKLNKATGPTAVVIPTAAAKLHGGAMYDADGEKALREVLKAKLRPRIKVVEVDSELNDPKFTEKVLDLLEELMVERPV